MLTCLNVKVYLHSALRIYGHPCLEAFEKTRFCTRQGGRRRAVSELRRQGPIRNDTNRPLYAAPSDTRSAQRKRKRLSVALLSASSAGPRAGRERRNGDPSAGRRAWAPG